MAKLPYMQFYPADYLRDTRCLSLAARGAWMDILCTLWNAKQRGKKSLTLEGWAGEIGKPTCDVSLCLLEIERNEICKISHSKDERITIICRRMLREDRARKLMLNRVQKHRDRVLQRSCNADETLVQRPIYQKSDIRSQNQISESEEELREEKKEKKKKEIKICAVPSAAAKVWTRYSEAYQARYKTEPVRNAKVNGQLSQLIKRIGEHSAPEVAAFYVWHNDQFYVRARHPPGLLLRDCEGLHTQWKTGQTVTQSQARKIDETQGRVNVFQELIDERKGQVIDVKTA